MAMAAATFAEGILLSVSQPALERGLTSTAFNFGSLPELWVRVKVPGMPHVGRLTLCFMNPKGDVIYESTVHFSPDPNMKVMPVDKPTQGDTGYAVHTATTVPGGFVLDYPVAIAGTVFDRLSMIGKGTWTVQAKVDGVDHLIVSTFDVKF